MSDRRSGGGSSGPGTVAAGGPADSATAADLLERARRDTLQGERGDGAPAALDELLARYGGRLLGLVRLKMGPALRARMESRDIAQAALLKAVERFDQLQAEGGRSFFGWLGRIAENEVRDQVEFHRRQRRDMAREQPLSAAAREAPAAVAPRLPPGLAASVHGALSRVILDEESRRLEAAIEALPEDHARVIVLRKLEELSFGQIGERLGRSPDACRMLCGRAMAALTLQLAEMEGAAAGGNGSDGG